MTLIWNLKIEDNFLIFGVVLLPQRFEEGY